MSAIAPIPERNLWALPLSRHSPSYRHVCRPLVRAGAIGKLRAGKGRSVVCVAGCAWLAQPVLIEELLFKTEHGIVDQSLHARMGAEPTNGDDFGLGWYGSGTGPGLYRSVSPAWADANLRECASHTEWPLFLAHVRAAIGSPVQQTNCHPFVAAAGCSFTTASWPTSTHCGECSCSRSTRRCSATSRDRPTGKWSSIWRSPDRA
jgi:hypothetical protein